MAKTKVSLRLVHPSLDLRAVASAIGFPVIRIWTAGQPRETPRGNPLEGAQKGSYCAFDISAPEGTIDEAVSIVHAALSKAAASQGILRSGEIEKSLYCTIIGSGEVIHVTALQQLADWGIRLELDC